MKTTVAMFARAVWGAALLLAALVGAGQAGAAPLPAPLLAFDFEKGAANTGTLGGEGKLMEYAAGQGPRLGPGLAGTGLWLDRASRTGGPGDDKVGGALLFAAPALDDLTQFTLAGWFRTESIGSITRLFYKNGAWDVMATGGTISLKLVVEKQDRHFHFGGSQPWGTGWEFVAVIVDTQAGNARLYRGRDGQLLRAGEAKGVVRPDSYASPVEIGNLGGIRPFKGSLDSIRLYGVALAEEQVQALFLDGTANRRLLRDGLGALPPLRGQGPKLSDVCFSTRFARPNAVETLKSFGATRCEWVYGSDPAFVRAIQDAGATYGYTINANMKVPNNEGTARDFDGKPIVAPWMVSWGAMWVTSTHPNTRAAFTNAIKQAVALGADHVQMDDPGLEAATVPWGGDFEPTTLRGFGAYLKANVPTATLKEWGITDTANFDYRAYLKQQYGIKDAADYKARLREIPTTRVWSDYLRASVRRQYTALRSQLDTEGGRRTPFSMNAYDPRPEAHRIELARFCDYIVSETPSADFARDALRSATVRALGIRYVASPIPQSVAATRSEIAGFYALGALALVPWDIYMGADATGQKPRYFGKVEDYGDLYALVRAHADLFDNREAPPVVGLVVPVDQYRDDETARLVRRLTDAQVPFAFALTGGADGAFSLDAERLSHFQAVVRVNPEADYREADLALLAKLPVPVLSPADLTYERLMEMAPLTVQGPRGVYAVPRLTADKADRSLVVHLVNRNLSPDGNRLLPQRYVSVTLRPLAQSGNGVARVTLYEPGQAPQSVEWDDTSEGPRLIVPRLREWAILRVEFKP